MSAQLFFFFFGIAVVFACMIASCVSVCAYLVSRNRIYRALLVLFVFLMLENALVFFDEYMGLKEMQQVILDVYPMSHPPLRFLFSVGTMAGALGVLFSIMGSSRDQDVARPLAAFAAIELLSFLIPNSNLQQVVFYAARSVFTIGGVLSALIARRASRDESLRGYIGGFRRVLVLVGIVTVFVLVEDVLSLIFGFDYGLSQEWGYYLMERNISENVLTIALACLTVRAASQILALRFKEPPTTEAPSAQQLAEVRFDRFCTKRDISSREREVLKLMLDGKDNRAIASELFISIGTVKAHVHAIYKKTGASSRTELQQAFWSE